MNRIATIKSPVASEKELNLRVSRALENLGELSISFMRDIQVPVIIEYNK